MYVLPVIIVGASASLLLGMGRFIGKKGAILLSVCSLALSTGISFTACISGIKSGLVYFYTFGSWLEFLGPISIKWEFQFDTLSLAMIAMVTFISTLVHIYSWSYMGSDPFLIRFIGLLSLFTFFMLILLSSSNFIQLFLGWEGIGICSYFLIGFWYTRVQANKSALKAMIVNRVGDIALLTGMGLVTYGFKSLDFSTIFSLIPLYSGVSLSVGLSNISIVELISATLLVAAVGKSAQIGLHMWLPDAMEGPTPVSALIHAATMVTAGIFLVVRCSFIFEYAPTSLLCVTLLGSLTAFFAATSGLVQNDIKKVIAYSTCSQLGYMFYACGLSNYIGGVFHLINHAFFKALLFLSAGSIIHALGNEQDMRRMGSISAYTPVTYVCLVIGSLALTGFPFLDGFYSKDFILEFALLGMWYHNIYAFALVLTVLTAICTFVYSMRLLYLVFLARTNTYRVVFSAAHESDWILLLPLITLVVGSLFFGFIFRDSFIGSGSSLWNNSILQISSLSNLIDVENLLNLKLLLLIIIFGAGVTSIALLYFFFHSKTIRKSSSMLYKSPVADFLTYKWYFDYIWNLFIKTLFNLAYVFWAVIDKGVLEFIQPIGFTNTLYTFHKNFYWTKSNSFVFYGYTSILFFCVVFVIFCFLGVN